MAFKVSTKAIYSDGSVLKAEFDTNSVHFHEAYEQAEMEIYMQRWFARRKTPDTPCVTHISLLPFND